MQCGPNANEEGEMKPYATEEREVLHKSGETKTGPHQNTGECYNPKK